MKKAKEKTPDLLTHGEVVANEINEKQAAKGEVIDQPAPAKVTTAAKRKPRAVAPAPAAQVPAKVEGKPPALPQASDAMGYMAMIAEAAKNPAVDVAKMQALMDVHERIMDKQNRVTYNQALARVQSKMRPVVRKGSVKYDNDKHDKSKGQSEAFKFARYEDIDAVIRPIYQAEGFAISFNTKWGDTGATIYGTLSHIDGHSETVEMRLPLDSSGGKNNLQGMGSTLSYGKRYIIGMFFNIVTVGEDTDGNIPDAIMESDKSAELDLLLREREKLISEDKRKEVRPRFLAHMGVDKIENLKAKDYEAAKTALMAIGQKPQQKKA